MGRSKPLLPLGDTDFIGTIIAALGGLDTGVGRVVVVRREDDEALGTRLSELTELLGRTGAATIIQATVPAGLGDMLASIRSGYGIGAMHGEFGALVWPVDSPFASSHTLASVLGHARQHPERVVRPVHAGSQGHPIWVPASVLRAEPPQGSGPGLRGLIEALSPGLEDLVVEDPGCLVNVNTPEAHAAYSRAGR
jgi:molybdenum cofactor cytidylyltransferase